MRNDSGNKTALVLSGGGAYGAYEVGVIKALFEGRSPSTSGPLDPGVFVGTSVGSFNAAVLAMNKAGALESLQRLHAIWTDQIADNGDGRGNGVYRIRGNPEGYLDPRLPGSPIEQLHRLFADAASLGREAVPRVMNLLSPGTRSSDRLKDLVDISMFIDTDPFRQLVEDSLDPRAIRESPKVLRVIATRWRTGRDRNFDFRSIPEEETWQAIRASAAIPGLFPPVQIGEDVYVDGGVVQNTPIKPAVEEGASEIHVVSLNPKMREVPESYIDNALDTFTGVYAAMLATMMDEDIASARWVNQGVEVMERLVAQEDAGNDAGEDVGSGTMREFARVAGVIYDRLRRDGKLPRKLTIHRYYPKKSLGDMLGMLNFRRSAIDDMIDDGYADACAHDCKMNGCVIPAAAVERLKKAAASTAS